MKVRIRFSKTGALVYIGHLDVMRYFQKLFRRSDIPVAYSEGFSPHQILSFTPPLPLGMESVGEYADVELIRSISTADALRALRDHSVPEIKIQSFKLLPDRCENAMASVYAARYSIDTSASRFDARKSFDRLLSQETAFVVKKTKKNEKEIDILPLIYELNVNDNGMIDMLISSGSSDNIKPELVLFAAGAEDIDKMTIKRIDQYTLVDQKIVSLDDIGEEIT